MQIFPIQTQITEPSSAAEVHWPLLCWAYESVTIPGMAGGEERSWSTRQCRLLQKQANTCPNQELVSASQP